MPLFETFPYANFHNLNLDWILRQVKRMENVMDNLNDTIHNIVEDELSKLNLEQIILETVTRYGLAINVVSPPNNLKPADPTGTNDSTSTIQGCIDYANANGGGVVFFPAGHYLTNSLTLKNNVALIGFDYYTTHITLRGGATSALLNGTVQNCYVGGLTLDGNAEVQVKDITVLALNCNNCGFSNLYLTSGFILMAITGEGNLIWGDNIRFGNCVQNALVTLGSGNFRFTNMFFESLSSVGGICVVNINNDNGIYSFKSIAKCKKCCDVSGDNNIINAVIENANTKLVDNGENNSIVSYKDILKQSYENYSLYVSGDFIIGSLTADVEISGKNVSIEGNDFKMNQSNPTTYKTPTKLNTYFNSVPFKDINGEQYNVLVYNPDAPEIGGEVYPELFGAIGDGETNDYDAFVNMFEFANANNTPVKFIYNKTYLLAGSDSIKISVSADFNDSILKVEFPQSVALFSINTETTNKNVTQSVISNLKTTDNELFNKSFLITSPLSMGDRNSTTYYHSQLMETDSEGNFVNSPYYPNVIAGNYSINNIQERNLPWITMERVCIEYSNSNYTTLFDISRNNVRVEGISSRGTTANRGQIIRVINCCHVKISDIVCRNYYNGTPNNSWGYCINLQYASDISINNVYAIDGWANIAGAFCTNTLIENCNVNIISHHYGLFGRTVIKNCTVNNVQFSYGYGLYVIENCVFMRYSSIHTNYINQRKDFALGFFGTFKILNCKFYKNDDITEIISYANMTQPDNFADFNVDDVSLVIENCRCDELSQALLYMRGYTSAITDVTILNCITQRFVQGTGTETIKIFNSKGTTGNQAYNVLQAEFYSCKMRWQGSSVQNWIAHCCEVYSVSTSTATTPGTNLTYVEGCIFTTDLEYKSDATRQYANNNMFTANKSRDSEWNNVNI